MLFCRHVILLVATAVLLNGCGYTKLAVGKIRARLNPTPESLKNSAPEKCILVTGEIRGDVIEGAPVAVIATAPSEMEEKVVGYTVLSGPGTYYLYLPEGRYRIMVITDVGGEIDHDEDELFGRRGKSIPLVIEKGRAVSGMIRGVDISIDHAEPRGKLSFELDTVLIKGREKSAYIPSGAITTFDDERFDEENGFLGLYQPAAYLERVNKFFYMLEEYDPGKIPVVFIHGIQGTPKDWEYIVKGLDRKHFQPWFFYYPSGLRLETVARIFYDTFLSSRELTIDRMVIAAHSQGGLVAREAMNISGLQGGENVPQLFISFCTPYGGIDMAATAVAHSPVIVPSWIDMASGSEYLNKLHKRELPRKMKFHLLFAFGSNHLLRLGPNDDGSVSLKSQLDPDAQKEATRMRGFNETHGQILKNKEVLEEFNSILAEARW